MRGAPFGLEQPDGAPIYKRDEADTGAIAGSKTCNRYFHTRGWDYVGKRGVLNGVLKMTNEVTLGEVW